MAKSNVGNLTASLLLQKFPEVHEFVLLQIGCQEAKYEEKLKFWRDKKIKCFERWTVPYFIEREKDKKRPCLRLNYRPNGQCKDCSSQNCIYDTICFMCGHEGHGAFHTHPGGKHQGQLKCLKHKKFLDQMAEIKDTYSLTEENLKEIVSQNLSTQHAAKKNNANATLLRRPHSSSVGGVPLSTKSLHSTGSSNGSIVDTMLESVSISTSTDSVPAVNSVEPSAWSQTNNLLLNKYKDNNNKVSSITSTIHSDQSTAMNGSPIQTNLPTQQQLLQQYHGSIHSNQISINGNIITNNNTSATTISQLNNNNNDNNNSYINKQPPPLEYELVDYDSYDSPVTVHLVMAAENIIREGRGGTTIFKASLVFTKYSIDAAVKTWPLANHVNITRLNQELSFLKKFSTGSPYIVNYLHPSCIEIEYPPNSKMKWCGIVMEQAHTDLDTYTKRYFKENPNGFPLSDLQTITMQLLDAYLYCHQCIISHKTVLPSNILIMRGQKSSTPLFDDGLILKLGDFNLASYFHNYDTEQVEDPTFIPTLFTAPEVIELKTLKNYSMVSDIWSIGCILYYIATKGRLLFETINDIILANTDDEFRKSKLLQHGLQDKLPMMYDLIERMVRPIHLAMNQAVVSRISLPSTRCHPFHWNMTTRKKMILYFSDSILNNTESRQSIISFKEGLDRFSPSYVFSNNGWVDRMCPDFLPYIYPVFLKDEGWWSGEILLQVIRNQIVYPDAMHAALFGELSVNQMLRRYLLRVIDTDFPKLLVLIYELAGWYGEWKWDGSEVTHSWT